MSSIARSADNDSNIGHPKYPQYNTQQARLDSFIGWPGRYVPKIPEELSASGFFYIGSADRVRCFHCGITLRNWEEENDPVTEHMRYSQTCKYIQRVVKEKAAWTRALTRDVGGRERKSKPELKHPEYESKQARLETFSKWPGLLFPKHPAEMAAAGFIYTGAADFVTCFRCGITQGGWRKEHNPVLQHLKHSKRCVQDHLSQQVRLVNGGSGEGLTVSHSHVGTGSDGFDTSGLRSGPAAALSRDQMIEAGEAIDLVVSDELFGDPQTIYAGRGPIWASYGMSGSEACNDVMSEAPHDQEKVMSGSEACNEVVSGGPVYREDMITGNPSNDVIFGSKACDDLMSGAPDDPEKVMSAIPFSDPIANTSTIAQSTASMDVRYGASRNVKPDSSNDKSSGSFRNMMSGSFRNLISGSFRNMMSGSFRNLISGSFRNMMSEEPKNPKEAPVTSEASDIMAAKAEDDGSDAPGAIAAEPKGDDDDQLLGMNNKLMACFGFDKI